VLILPKDINKLKIKRFFDSANWDNKEAILRHDIAQDLKLCQPKANSRCIVNAHI
jgi:hypothetical protein